MSLRDRVRAIRLYAKSFRLCRETFANWRFAAWLPFVDSVEFHERGLQQTVTVPGGRCSMLPTVCRLLRAGATRSFDGNAFMIEGDGMTLRAPATDKSIGSTYHKIFVDDVSGIASTDLAAKVVIDTGTFVDLLNGVVTAMVTVIDGAFVGGDRGVRYVGVVRLILLVPEHAVLVVIGLGSVPDAVGVLVGGLLKPADLGKAVVGKAEMAWAGMSLNIGNSGIIGWGCAALAARPIRTRNRDGACRPDRRSREGRAGSASPR